MLRPDSEGMACLRPALLLARPYVGGHAQKMSDTLVLTTDSNPAPGYGGDSDDEDEPIEPIEPSKHTGMNAAYGQLYRGFETVERSGTMTWCPFWRSLA